MFYGNNTFAEDAFSSPGVVDASVAVTGVSLATAQGDETITTSVTATPTGIALSATQNSVTIFVPDVTVVPTGIATSTAIGPYSIVTDTETTIVVGAEALIETSIGTPVVSGSAVATPTGIALATAQGDETIQTDVSVSLTGEELTTVISQSVDFTAQGNAQLSTAQKKFGTASLLLDGTGDFVTSTNSDLVNGDFTVEFFAYASSFAQDVILWDQRVNDQGYAIGLTTGSQIKVIQDTTTIATSFGGFTNNSFNHIALSRDSGTIRVFVNGNLRGTLSVYNNNYTGQPNTIGASHEDSNYFDGYIDEFRTSSIARYTSAFTPTTTAFVDDSDTISLLHFDGSNGSVDIINSHPSVSVSISVEAAVTGEDLTSTVGDADVEGSAVVTTTGIALSVVQGTATAVLSVDAAVTGIQMTSAEGDITATGSADVSLTGIEITSAQSQAGVVAWSPVVPGVSNVYTPVDDSNSNTWTAVDDSATNTWTEVDDREVA